MRKYSCSGPTVVTTLVVSVSPSTLRILTASSLILSIERRRGVFLSRASPVYEQNAVGMQRVSFFTNA